MKKLFLLTAAIACALTAIAQQGATNFCNSDEPEWGNSLGKVSFKSTKTWKIGDQEWSDVVIASACQKTRFDGGSEKNFNADCRKNDGYGDLFSWCAVVRFRNQLCPGNWNVPNASDFSKLIKNGNDVIENSWGISYGGSCRRNGEIVTPATGAAAHYWSRDEIPQIEVFDGVRHNRLNYKWVSGEGKYARYFYFHTMDKKAGISSGRRNEYFFSDKSRGRMLRCVR